MKQNKNLKAKLRALEKMRREKIVFFFITTVFPYSLLEKISLTPNQIRQFRSRAMLIFHDIGPSILGMHVTEKV